MNNFFRKSWSLFFVVAFTLMLFPRFVHAYIDPGTGSFIIQAMIAAVVGSLFVIKIYWRKLISFFKRVFSRGGK